MNPAEHQQSPSPGGRRRPRGGDFVFDERGTPLQLDGLIGSGGQGEVWSLKGGRAAVKLSRHYAEEGVDEIRNRLRVVDLTDLTGVPLARPLAMLGNGHRGYVMELLADMVSIGSLASPTGDDGPAWYRRTGGLVRRLRLLRSLAEALAALHGKGLVYGDVSPTNVLVPRSTERHHVWLIDPDNLAFESEARQLLVYTPGYGAPELVRGSGGASTLADAHAFAVIAFQTLVLEHPFLGDEAHDSPALAERAYRGELPWIDDPGDDRNRSRSGVPRARVLTPGLRALFDRTFGPGRGTPVERATIGEWLAKLDQAALLTVRCTACQATYFGYETACPWCTAPRPPIIQVDVVGSVPAQPDLPGFSGGETGLLASLVVSADTPTPVTARTALTVLDHGPMQFPTDADQPVVELRWLGGPRVVVRRVGRHLVRLVDPGHSRSVALRANESAELPISGGLLWTIRFDDDARVHRFLRIRQRSESA